MKKLFLIVSILILSNSFLFSQHHKMMQDLTQYVNPFIGTGGHGHTYPGASMPFGMVQLSPDTRLEGWDGCSGYNYSDSIIYGFSHMHLSGTGVPDYCDILIMPTVGDVKFTNYDYSSTFTHAKEFGSPGYYSVYLEKYKVKAELTCTERAGFHKYTFPKSEKSGFILDLHHRETIIESSIEIMGNNEIRGMHRTKGWARNKYVYFVMKLSKPFKKVLIAQNDTDISEITKAEGKNIKAYVSFDTKDNEVVYVKTGISAVSEEGALKNLDMEIPGWDFDVIQEQAHYLWNMELNKIVVDDPRNELKMIFYSALYHCMLAPNLYEDIDGQFRGTDLKIHSHFISKIEEPIDGGIKNYTVFSLWDTFRAEHPLLTIIDTKRTNDFINTFLAEYEYGGMLPVWELSGNETFCMIGYHSVPVIVDAYMKGIRGFDAYKALEAMKSSAERDWFGLESYKKFGFVSQDLEHESVSKTLEYAYDDWCISQLAKELGDKEDYDRYILRAQNYKNVFDPSTGFMRAKINGGWYSPFDPLEVNSNYTEANCWQYNFYVPQDMDGLIALYNGKQNLAKKLDELFSTQSNTTEQLEDISGLIGQYAHGNEPSHHMAYLYDYVNQPWKTQELVHKIMTEFYKNDPDGLIGNEDCGQMSAWFVMSALGIYSVCPGQLQYAIGTPLFKKVTVNMESGKKFVIEKSSDMDVRGSMYPERDYYIFSSELNYKLYNKCFINHNDITSGGNLIFYMGGINKNWGSKDEDVPRTTINNQNFNFDPYIESSGKSFKGYELISIKSDYPGPAIYYTTDGTDPDINSVIYSSPFEINKTTTVKCFAFYPEMGKSPIIEGTFYKIPEGRSIKINSTYSPRYSAGGPDALIDMIRGKKNWRLGDWQGYEGQDFDAVVDLGKMQKVNKVGLGCLMDVGSWIWFPTQIDFSSSKDGVNFEPINSINIEMPPKEGYKVEIKDYIAEVNLDTRYIKVRANHLGKIPIDYPGEGEDMWLFVDEIIIE
jgi:predicted alpha-1,2-mannosidase